MPKSEMDFIHQPPDTTNKEEEQTTQVVSRLLSEYDAEKRISDISLEEHPPYEDGSIDNYNKQIDNEKPCFLIEYGGKVLYLNSSKIEESTNGKTCLLVDTFLINTKQEKRTNETTIVFEESFRLLQEFANTHNTEVTLHIETFYKNIAMWLINNSLTLTEFKKNGVINIGDMRKTTLNMQKITKDELLQKPEILEDHHFLLSINITFYPKK